MKTELQPVKKNILHVTGRALIPWIIPFIIVIVWQILASSQTVTTRLFPSPRMVLESGWELIASGKLWYHMQISLARAAAGLLIGGGIGFILGIANGLSNTFYRLFDNTIQMLRNIPHLAVVPLVILWMGIDESSKIFLVSIGVLFPIYVNTYHGIRSVNPGFLEIGKVYGLSPWKQFRHIVLPGALPSVFVGLRYALGVMWLTLIVAETFSTDRGIGYLALDAREFMKGDIIILSVIIYALFGKLADVVAKWLERSILRWNSSYTS